VRQKQESVSNKIPDSACEIMNKVVKPDKLCYNGSMNQTYILQKTNDKGYRRFCAKVLGDRGGTTNSLRNALTWDNFANAETFRIINNLTQFNVVLSDGTDDEQAEVQAYWAAKNGK
jgi:hypothetical protein